MKPAIKNNEYGQSRSPSFKTNISSGVMRLTNNPMIKYTHTAKLTVNTVFTSFMKMLLNNLAASSIFTISIFVYDAGAGTLNRRSGRSSRFPPGADPTGCLAGKRLTFYEDFGFKISARSALQSFSAAADLPARELYRPGLRVLKTLGAMRCILHETAIMPEAGRR